MQRLPDWASRLESFLQENAGRRFQYGDWDCCLFVCDAIRVMTGIDPAKDFRGEYASAKTSVSAMYRVCGVRSLKRAAEQIALHVGMAESPPEYARRGDVVLLKRAKSWSLGMVALDGTRALVVGENSLIKVPMLMAKQAWLVG